MISYHHPNRCAYNWLIYDTSDRFLERYIPFYKGVLYDLGSGESPYKEFFLKYVEKYIAVDWSESFHATEVDIAADLNGPLPLQDQVADTIISLSVMEHLKEPQVFLGEAQRILKPGGVMILQTPFMWWVHEAPHDYYRYTRHGLKYLFEKAGFSAVEVYPQTGFWTMWTLKFNYQTARLVRGRWPVRQLVGLIMGSVWAIDQPLARWLDRHWKCEEETAGYFVVARKT